MTMRPRGGLVIARGGVLLWPKSMLRLEAARSTPTTTQPQQGMNINTPTTQLASPVVPSDSGRGEEVAPLVAKAVAANEEAMHDIDAIYVDEDDDDTQQYLNTGTYDNG